MKNWKILFVLLLCLTTIISPQAEAGGHGSGRHSGGGRSSYSRSSYSRSSYHPSYASHTSSRTHSYLTYSTKSKHNSNYAIGVKRNSSGRIARSSKATSAFKKSHPCPSTGKSSGSCKGYVIDHVQALKHGGADAPSNMQWQTKEAAKLKDKTE